MCEWCASFGHGEQWQFNPENYARRLYKLRKESKEATGAESSPVGGFPQAPDVLELIHAQNEGDMETYAALLHEHESKAKRDMLGQVVDIKEIIKAVDFMYPIARMTCMCRRLTQSLPDDQNFTCIAMGPGVYKWERWPEMYRGGIEFLHPDDAREFLTQLDNDGYAHILFTMGTPYIGGLCNCQYPDCLPLRQQFDYGLRSIWKGHYVARVDPNLCTGCGLCAARCQFKAINFDPSRNLAHINMLRCYGCGLCASVCKTEAITLTERRAIPTLANVW